MIIELVGLPGAGKTRIADALAARGAIIVAPKSRFALIRDVLVFESTHPFTALRLATYIVLHAPKGMRYTLYVNTYLGSAAKWTEARRIDRQGRVAVIDQGFGHSAVSLAGIPEHLVRALPKADRLVIVEAPDEVRHTRMQVRGRTPRSEQGTDQARAWDEAAKKGLGNTLPFFLAAYSTVIHVDGTRSVEENVAATFAHPHQRAPRASFLKGALLCFAHIFSFLTPRTGAAILMYHAVDESGWRLAIPPEAFKAQMQHLASHATVVPLGDVVAFAKGEKDLPKDAVALTFDDGFHDLVSVVLPLLEAYKLPATLFLTTDLTARTNIFGTPRLSEDDLKVVMQSEYITIESHGRTHPHLPALDPDAVIQEVTGAQADLASRGVVPKFFAYPFGDRTAFVEDIVRNAGYEAAVAITEGFVRKGADLLHLPRIQVDTTQTLHLFRARLTGALTLNRWIVTLLRV